MSYIIQPKAAGILVLNRSSEWTPLLNFAQPYEVDDAHRHAKTSRGAVVHELPTTDAITSESQPIIFVKVVPDAERLQFLPTVFGRRFLQGESAVYDWMRQLCEQYNGAYWEFFRVSNGTYYMAPQLKGPLKIEWWGNDFQSDLSCDAAGIVACLFAYSEMWERTRDDKLLDCLEKLKVFARSHPEWRQIFRAID